MTFENARTHFRELEPYLNTGQMMRLARNGHRLRMEEGDQFHGPEGTPTALTLIESGRVLLTLSAASRVGGSHTTILGSGDCFGDFGLPPSESAIMAAVVMTGGVAYSFELEELQLMTAADTDLAGSLVRTALARRSTARATLRSTALLVGIDGTESMRATQEALVHAGVDHRCVEADTLEGTMILLESNIGVNALPALLLNGHVVAYATPSAVFEALATS